MKLELPDVTLVTIETRERALASMALEDCLRKVNFADVLIFTDQPADFSALIDLCNPRFVIIEDFSDKISWSRCRWNEIAPHLATSHLLYCEWDAFVWDASMWRDDFLQWDFIGSPWWYKDGRNVGNGGFSLRSTRLMRYVRKHRATFPCDTPVDDDLLCRKYRPALEEKGFMWAPQDVARNFAFECIQPDPLKTFGFHGMFNWHIVLDEDQLMQRAEIASHSNYIKKNERMWGAFCKNNPKIAQAFMPHGDPVGFDLHNEIAHHP